MENLNLKVDLSVTTAIKSEDGNQIFAEGVILRRVSKFVAGTTEDAVIPIPCFYDVKTGKVLIELLPKDLRPLMENDD